MNDARSLHDDLSRIDGRGYKAYRSLADGYRLEAFELRFEHIQGDPFAAPSLLSISIPFGDTGFSVNLLSSRIRAIASADFLARVFRRNIGHIPHPIRGTGKSGSVSIDAGEQEVLERTCLSINRQELVCRFYVGLPAQGRRVLGRQAQRLLLESVPFLVEQSFLASAVDLVSLQREVDCVEDQQVLRQQLAARGLVCFLANGSVLPRLSGVEDRPLETPACVPFRSPASLDVVLEAPNAGSLHGMGIPKGITLIAGGGFHGKSTLLKAIERGIYDHIPGDGRERVVTLESAAKIRAEDGRSVQGVDISAFINNLPQAQTTCHFSTQNASGSTSQAANIVEALELGSRLLLIDEDTSATNFIIRDARMQALVSKESEPITPLIDRIQELAQRFAASCILVMGGSGDYFDVCDRVIMMQGYTALDVSREAREVALSIPSRRHSETASAFPERWTRRPDPDSFDARRGRRETRIDARGLYRISYGTTEIDLSLLEQLVDPSQTRAVGLAIEKIVGEGFRRGETLSDSVQAWDELVGRRGLGWLSQRVAGNLARPRGLEVGAAINRMRTLRLRATGPSEG